MFMGENIGRGSDTLLWLVKQSSICMLNCKAGGSYPLAAIPIPPRAFICFMANHYSRWRGSVQGRNQVPWVGCLLLFGVLRLWGDTASPHLCRLTCLNELVFKWLTPPGFCLHFLVQLLKPSQRFLGRQSIWWMVLVQRFSIPLFPHSLDFLASWYAFSSLLHWSSYLTGNLTACPLTLQFFSCSFYLSISPKILAPVQIGIYFLENLR